VKRIRSLVSRLTRQFSRTITPLGRVFRVNQAVDLLGVNDNDHQGLPLAADKP